MSTTATTQYQGRRRAAGSWVLARSIPSFYLGRRRLFRTRHEYAAQRSNAHLGRRCSAALAHLMAPAKPPAIRQVRFDDDTDLKKLFDVPPNPPKLAVRSIPSEDEIVPRNNHAATPAPYPHPSWPLAPAPGSLRAPVPYLAPIPSAMPTAPEAPISMMPRGFSICLARKPLRPEGEIATET